METLLKGRVVLLNGKRQNADPRSADYLRGPGPWTTLVDHLRNFAERTMDRALLTQV
jgi:hypothetical protein